MIIEQTTLYNEVMEAFSGGAKPAHYLYGAVFEIEGALIEPIKVDGLHIDRQYTSRYADAIMLYVTFPLGKFTKRVYPFKDSIRVTLNRTPQGEVTPHVNYEHNITSQGYRAILVDKGDMGLEGNIPTMTDEEDADRAGFINVQFQLLDEGLEYIRLKTTGGILRNENPGNALKTLLTSESINLPHSIESKIRGVTMVEPDNKERRKHILIPPIPVVDLPNFIQKDCGGIYSTGIGCYLQNGNWYIYPEYNTDRFETSRESLLIFNIPPQRLPHVERTYYVEGKSVHILSTGDVKHADGSEVRQLNEGNGVRFTDPGKMLEGFGKTENNRTRIQRGEFNNELKSSDRRTGLNNVRVSGDRFNSNVFYEYSKLASRKGEYLQVTWQNSQPELIKPGMPVRFYSYNREGLVKRDGVVVAAEHTITVPNPGLKVSKHSCNSAVTVFLKRLK